MGLLRKAQSVLKVNYTHVEIVKPQSSSWEWVGEMPPLTPAFETKTLHLKRYRLPIGKGFYDFWYCYDNETNTLAYRYDGVDYHKWRF